MKSDALLLQAGAGAAPTPPRPSRDTRGADERAPFGDTIARALRQASAQDTPPDAASGPKADAGEEQAATKGDASPGRGDETAAPTGDKSPAATAAAAAPVPTAAPVCAPVALPACVPAGANTTAEPASDRTAPEAAGETAAVDAQAGPAHTGQPGRTRPGGALAATSDRATCAAAPGADPAADASPVAATGTQDAREPRTEHPGARAASEFATHLAQARGTADANAAQALAAGLNVRGATSDAAAALPMPSSTLSTPVGSPAFPSHLAAEVATIGLAGIERAEIELRPRELGPVRVELSMSGESARIAFSAAHPDTRQAIEQTLPILKDLLAERGLMLAGASVSDGGAGSGRAATDDGAPRRYDGPAIEGGTAPGAPGPRPATAARRTLLDVYA